MLLVLLPSLENMHGIKNRKSGHTGKKGVIFHAGK
jgi:hypothetical protein